ncbi:MAG: hypothetical protein M3P18_25275 [Actinomycetota bacterium]|nr:hypothetical protein [Actinomycetota bacterium]
MFDGKYHGHLEETLVVQENARVEPEMLVFGHRLAEGIGRVIFEAGLPSSAAHLYAHSAYVFAPNPPPNANEYREADVPELRAFMRLYMATRGVWEAGWWQALRSRLHTRLTTSTSMLVFLRMFWQQSHSSW